MALSVRIEDSVVIPGQVEDFATFTLWTRSDDFPDQGRFDFLAGTIEVDMAPEELQSHGALKTELASWLHQVVKKDNLGQVFVARTRLTCPSVALSCEPDVLFVSLESLRAGIVCYRAGPDCFLEVEGAATLVIEVLSDSSVGKDTKRLPPLYAAAGVAELWLADARGPDLGFRVFHLEASRPTGREASSPPRGGPYGGDCSPLPEAPEYRAAAVDEEGFQLSRVLGRRVRLRREPWAMPGTWTYTLEES